MRLYEEIKKDLSSGCFLEILRMLEETTLLAHLLPELSGKHAELLNVGTALSEVIERVDQHARDGVEVPLTAILSALCIFLGSKSDLGLEDLAERFQSREEIREHLDTSFSHLAVPRKERERIEDTLLLWWKIVTADPDKVKSSTLERRRAIGETLWLLQLTSDGSELQSELIALAEGAAKSRERSSHRRKPSGRSQHNRGQHKRGQRGRGQSAGRGRPRGRSTSKKGKKR
jgi:hypothetical protein